MHMALKMNHVLQAVAVGQIVAERGAVTQTP